MSDEPRRLGGRYLLLSEIGRGAVADVWRARDERLGRDVAVKVFRGEAAGDLGDAQDEVRLLAALDHPGLVAIYDVGEEPGGISWIVMRLVEGEPLRDRMRRLGALPLTEVARYGAELASALAYVHRQGLVHRDVKPANVLIGRDGRVHLADFGIARIVDSPRRTMTGQVLGTPAYFAPEQVAGEAVGPPADVYALALVLLEAITGRREYTGQALEVAMARLNREPDIPADLPPAIFSLLVAMTQRDPLARPSALEVEQRLRRFLAGGEATQRVDIAATTVAAARPARVAEETAVLSTVRPAPVDYRPAAAPERRRVPAALLAIAALVVVLVAAGIVYAVTQNSSGQVTQFVTPGSPALQQPLEGKMEQLEQAVR